MGFVAIAFTAKVEFVGHNVTTLQEAANVMHVAIIGGASVATLQGIADTFENEYGTSRSLWPDDYEHDFTRVTDITSVSGNQATSIISQGLAGSEGANGDASNSALVKLLTTVRGRSTRGRIYHPCAKVDVNQGGVLGTTYVGNVTSYYNGLRAALQALSPVSDLVVASKKLGTSEPVISSQCEPVVANQRRRQAR